VNALSEEMSTALFIDSERLIAVRFALARFGTCDRVKGGLTLAMLVPVTFA
jgi:hypothetical protein